MAALEAFLLSSPGLGKEAEAVPVQQLATTAPELCGIRRRGASLAPFTVVRQQHN